MSFYRDPEKKTDNLEQVLRHIKKASFHVILVVKSALLRLSFLSGDGILHFSSGSDPPDKKPTHRAYASLFEWTFFNAHISSRNCPSINLLGSWCSSDTRRSQILTRQTSRSPDNLSCELFYLFSDSYVPSPVAPRMAGF